MVSCRLRCKVVLFCVLVYRSQKFASTSYGYNMQCQSDLFCFSVSHQLRCTIKLKFDVLVVFSFQNRDFCPCKTPACSYIQKEKSHLPPPPPRPTHTHTHPATACKKIIYKNIYILSVKKSCQLEGPILRAQLNSKGAHNLSRVATYTGGLQIDS